MASLRRQALPRRFAVLVLQSVELLRELVAARLANRKHGFARARL